MFIQILLTKGLSASNKITTSFSQTNNSNNANFDIKLPNSVSTTYDNRGWYVVFREYANGKAGNLQYVTGTNNGVANYDDLNFITKLSVDSVTSHLKVLFEITNNGNSPKTIDVGVFADIFIDKDDFAKITPLQGNRGFTMIDQSSGKKLTLLLKDSKDVTNVDTFFYGGKDDSYMTDEKRYTTDKFPYFKNMDYVTNYEGDYDSVFSFSWQKKTINPQETLSLSVVAGADADTSTPPYIKLTKEINERYNKNDKITVQFDVYEFDYQYDNSEFVKVYYEFDGKKLL
ncbi:hypothetical protein TVAG_470520 [Trichomonas vaginalis G3]|uniref:Uncharacterized protein n=1 Tax=Trichomonas vaginalis (strain ATCC PRA-98 / G3) TaxID=412133 RepID=A2EM97_TRIV3|nr:hypothetical protein TVAGG3_0719810 [Trichomonas vaginalis G3]EAY06209.1 hypothetical protein TVAG_470520 [Trichomonas vaginalis G3]KAI5510511.1 hypothetical protein TVAGG3_0719810 [Trichomonas vaginalis G3]|eukprot:XP_001318432.1 hypothetical protein [Trichomonas vaginalis G3]